MTSKIRILGVLLVLPLLSISAVTAFVDIPSANALTKRDYYTLNDQHTTASYGNRFYCKLSFFSADTVYSHGK